MVTGSIFIQGMNCYYFSVLASQIAVLGSATPYPMSRFRSTVYYVPFGQLVIYGQSSRLRTKLKVIKIIVAQGHKHAPVNVKVVGLISVLLTNQRAAFSSLNMQCLKNSAESEENKCLKGKRSVLTLCSHVLSAYTAICKKER